ncbi:MAG TPA: hypothetical protein VGK24_17915 [Candidatus Angelobacter sp.]|jgi:hypothetical protein
MASSVSAELLKQLSVVSQALNNATDQLNEQINTIEEALASYNLGVSGWGIAHHVDHEERDNFGNVRDIHTQAIYAGYEKRSGKWCLLASSIFDSDPDTSQEWILRDAPREIRLQAIDGIPKLLEDMIAKATKLSHEVSAKTAQAANLAQSIRPKKGQ